MREKLIGQQVRNQKTRFRGTIVDVSDDKVWVKYYDGTKQYSYPAAFASQLVLQDESLRREIFQAGETAAFDLFKQKYIHAVKEEIAYLRKTGGKRYHLIDGERISTTKREACIYSFDTDSELHFPDGTAVKIMIRDLTVLASVISCEDFTIVIQTGEDLGNKVESADMTADAWHLLEALVDRLDEMDAGSAPLANEIACNSPYDRDYRKPMEYGQDRCEYKASEEPILFIWGPPGTGKTTTLARIAKEKINQGKRVLMLSYSNVSVDGALLRVALISDQEPGQVIRYGYPRMKELLESDTLTSYNFVLHENPGLEEERKMLLAQKQRLKRKDPQRIEIDKRLTKIRSLLADREKELVQNAAFVATTVSKALVDSAIYSQRFDTVIFDEASMAYVPQIVFAAGLAAESFCCLGDFCQLPAIVQNPDDLFLRRDIFEYTGITAAVEDGCGHDWLVMLDKQYRMHPDIAGFISRRMYSGLLRTADGVLENRRAIADLPPLEGSAFSLVDLSSMYSVCIKTMDGSHINLLSAMICVRIAELYAGQYEIGIITPYSAQSRLMLAMIRDLQERDEKYRKITCATVHQFQGSEKAVIIFDAVDCYRMPYPGILLTGKKNDNANRLFNVAMTRAQGKFIFVGNKDYLFMKKIPPRLILTQALKKIEADNLILSGEDLYDVLGTVEGQQTDVFLGDRDEVDSWERYLEDLRNCQEEIVIDMPGVMDDDLDALDSVSESLQQAELRGVHIRIRAEEELTLPECLEKYRRLNDYTTTPITMIDKKIIWFGEPLSDADFISDGRILRTQYFPCLRFAGKNTARMLRAIYEIAAS